MNIKLKETKRWRVLWRVCSLPDIIERMFDDVIFEKMGRSTRNMRLKIRGIVSNPGNHVFRVIFENKFAGCFVLFDLGGGDYEVHTLLKKEFHGLYAVRIGRYATAFGLNLPYVKKLISFCPNNMPETFLFAKMCGWKSLGELPAKWIKNGVEYGVKGVWIRKEDFLCLS